MANITKVYLLSVPLEKDYAHTLYFASATDQYNYFAGNRKKSFENFSYQRKDSVIRIPAHIDSLYAAGCNYVMYQNADYSNKWFYAFIEDMQYINDENTAVRIRTDCIQTWMFDITVKPSFVEREHATTDEIGDHTLEEGLETGEFIVNNRYSLNYGSKLCIIVAVAKNPEGERETGFSYHGVYSGLRYYVFKAEGSVAELNEFLAKYDSEGVGESVVSMFLAPATLADKEGVISYGVPLPESWEPNSTYINRVSGAAAQSDVVQEFSKNYIDNQYIPRNKKLMCFPYRYLLVTNNAGAAATYKFEKFFLEAAGTGERTRTQIEPAFIVKGCITPGCSIRMYPSHYNGAAVNYEEGINMGKFPVLNWTSDAYTNWLTQNSVNIGLQIAAGAGQIIAGAALAVGTAGVGVAVGGGQIVGGVSQIAGTLSQIHQQSFAPDQIKGNLNSGDVITAMGANSFDFYVMSIKNEYAKVIDEYFDMFGYKCHRVKVPAKAHRAAYWYTKTIDANITGAIPQDDLQTIKDCYNRGITFWRNSANFKNYGVSNAIV